MKRFAKAFSLCIAVSLLVAMLCSPIQALGTSNTQYIAGYGTVGEGVGTQTTVVDFGNGDLCGFAPLTGTESVTAGTSAVWQAGVLKTHLSSPTVEAGIQKTFHGASILAGVSTLSVQQVAQANSYVLTLRLSGIDENGTPLVWEASTKATTNHWQTITFDVSSFVSLVDIDAPVTLSLMAASESEASIGADWMIKSIYASTPQTIPEFVLPLAAVCCGFVFGFAFFFMIYRTTCKKNKRPFWEEER